MADLVEALRALAHVESNVDSFSAPGSEIAVHVEISRDSDGDFSSLTLRARYDDVARAMPGLYRDGEKLVATRPLEITLRREHEGDRAAKKAGTSVEWQAGEPAFDDEVYVSTPTSEPRVLAAVLGKEVRAATRDLLAMGFEQIQIDTVGGKVEARSSRGTRARREASAAEVIEAFGRLALGLPAIAHSGATRPAPPLAWLTTLLGIVGAVGWLLNVTGVGLLAMAVDAARPGFHDGSNVPPEAIGVAIVLAILAGLVGGWGYGELIRSTVHGSSQAHEIVGRARFAAFGGFSVIALYACALAALVLYD
ncbi:MAG: hypothetical protein U0234_23990 [Sandaracinus sp.]